MTHIDTMLMELDQETRATRRLLERVPDAELGWKPHERAMTLGQLALHVASIPGAIAELAMQSQFQEPKFTHPSAQRAADLVPALDQSIARAKALLGGLDAEGMAGTWRLVDGDRELMSMPRAAVLRVLMLNHWYHHRGQLSVYLRQLGVPLPAIYGPSADENPFAARKAPAVAAATTG